VSTELIEQFRERADEALERCLPAASTYPKRLHEAMRYAVLGGGKRIRPVLVYSAGAALDVPPERLDPPACAVELIHAYSLVHDDLPAMDDDDLRRGRPTCHKAYDEATAILVGDALQALAFQAITAGGDSSIDPATRTEMAHRLAMAVGSRGLVGGQAIDLAAVGQDLTFAELELMHIHKTGALIRTSVLMGAMCAPEPAADALERLDHYGKCVGLAFQIQDDILDVVGDTQTLGKRQGADQALDKPTYVSHLGLDGARRQARDLHEDAMSSLADFGTGADPLRWISSYIVERAH